jgi:biopolymer transport protein ExbD
MTVAANGTLTLGDRVVAERDLDEALATVAKRHPRLAIAPYGAATVDKLLQRAKAAGFTDIIFTSK